ncbi:MAG TPA: DUF4410 domain-containing protein [Terriglobales bacterium]|nr:DUF4410 domain-containing protein [Terriglobales bacterium]
MTLLRTCAAGLVVLFVATGCASTEVTQRQYHEGEQLPRPAHILVYDFTADPALVPAQSAFVAGSALSYSNVTEQELGLTQQLGAEIARQVTEQLQHAGLPAVQVNSYTPGQPSMLVNDVAIHGYFISVDEGSTMKRMLIGFGSGNAEMSVAVEGFQMNKFGLRPLGNGVIDSGGNKTGGVLLPAAVMAATASPVGLAVSGTMKLAGEATGDSTIEGNARRTADLVSEQLIEAAKRQGWL